MADLPASLRITSPFPFVGRDSELETLRTLLPSAEGEGRRVVLLGGEPGSGKSRLVREFAALTADHGTLVLYGACDAVVRTPYGPFAQALRRLTHIIEPPDLQAWIGQGAAELTRLLPELSTVLGELPAPAKADPDTERHRLHTAVAELLARLSQRQPVVLAIEDMHWADASTLLLLRHLSLASWTGRVLMFATFRDTTAEMPETLSQTLADLRRADDVVRLRVGGLSPDDIAEFVERSLGSDAEAELPIVAQKISEMTDGNAFLVCELWRALAETALVENSGGTLQMPGQINQLVTPDSVREVVSQRLTRLAPATTQLLELAAVAGTGFSLDLLRCASGLPESTLLDALDEAVRSGFLEELAGPHLAHRFTHELVRRAVHDRLTGVRQAELHLKVGETLEAGVDPPTRALPDLAYHFAAAAPLGDTRRAIKYNVLAARAATEALAFDEAADMLRTALELSVGNIRERAEMLLELGTALHRAGKASDALDAFASAAKISRRLDDAELLSRAAIGHEEASWRPSIGGDITLLEEAANSLGDQPSELRVGVLSGLARALDMQGQHERAASVRPSTIALAHRLGDRRGLAAALTRSYWARGAMPISAILEMLGEARALGEELEDPEIQAEALSWTVPALVAIADVGAARTTIALLHELARITAQPFYLHVAEHYGSAIALADGDLTAAEAMAARSERAGRLLTGRDASGTYGVQMFSLRREQGRLAELAPVIRILAARDRERGAWLPGLVSLLVELGMEDEARRQLDRIVSEGLDPLRQSLWTASLTYLTDACAALGHGATAALVYPELSSLAGENVMIGHLVACYGSADRYLGMLAATLGEWELAAQHFEQAVELNRQMGARTWLAHAEYEYARMLMRRGGEGSRSTELLRHAAELAATIGMTALTARTRASGAPVRLVIPLPDKLSPREAEILWLVARGLSNRAIGEALFISEHTAANHVRSILRKTGCGNRTEAAVYAHRHSLADAEGRA